MELVYLWVEDYKNIYKQGFNFSPRFECTFHDKYDKDGNLEDDCTLEINPKEHIENFFGDNINVTAIVGENGSGKSSLFELIYYILYYNFMENEEKINLKRIAQDFVSFPSGRAVSAFRKKNYQKILNNLKEEKIKVFLIVEQNEEKYLLSSTSKYDTINTNIKKFNTKIDSKFIYFNFFGTSFVDKFKKNWYRAFYKDIEHIKNDVNLPLYAEPYISCANENISTINDNNLYYRYARVFEFIKGNEVLNNIFKPNTIRLKLNKTYFYDNLKTLSLYDPKENPLLEFSDNQGYSVHIQNTNKKYIFNKKEKFNDIKLIIKKYIKNNNIEKLMQIYVLFEILLNAKAVENHTIVYLGNMFVDETNFDDLLKIIDKDYVGQDNKVVSIVSDDERNLLELDNIIWILDSYEEYSFLENLNQKHDVDELVSVLKYIPKWINISFLDKTKTINSLSSGEKSLFSTVVNVFYHLFLEGIDYSSQKNIYIFLDEIEVGKHPQWQKSLINQLINIFNSEYNIHLNIILATHSPFILSDLPKENILFLDKYKKDEDPNQQEGNCKVLKDGIQKQTFGANIHTLLSDGFFMSGGLMGEFAKRKITTILRFLNGKNKFINIEKRQLVGLKLPNNFIQKQIKPIIEIIGEDFLREKLLHLYNRFYKLETKEQKYINEISQLREEINRLKNG